MTDEPTNAPQDLILSAKANALGVNFDLISRGLEEVEDILVTSQQIADARTNNKMFGKLSNLAIKIAIEQSANWELRLFAQIISDEVLAAEDLLKSLMIKQASLKGNVLDGFQVQELIRAKVIDSKSLLKRFDTLINVQLEEAEKASEQPDGINKIILAAHEYGIIYRDFLDWSLGILYWRVPTTFERFQFVFCDMLLPAITDMAFLGQRILNMIDNAHLSVGEVTSLTFNLKVKVRSPERIEAELAQAIAEWINSLGEDISRPEIKDRTPKCNSILPGDVKLRIQQLKADIQDWKSICRIEQEP